MKPFKKINRIYAEASGDHLFDELEVSGYRQNDTVAMPISKPIRVSDDEKHYEAFVEAIESISFIYWEGEDKGFSYQLKNDKKTNTFSLEQSGQRFISRPQSRKGVSDE
tara:strand:- start:144 stop:470 length:327 start_codon:yes stop_codon:yes gene_type:complete